MMTGLLNAGVRCANFTSSCKVRPGNKAQTDSIGQDASIVGLTCCGMLQLTTAYIPELCLFLTHL
jgi:hypothetical protein